ncbi:MAG: helix-turn-helix domain-containing protein [FCB group bacterium]|jgi:hypothetical protein|nr:helix-turn-helix domain-containing protein [FCB group bacterium]
MIQKNVRVGRAGKLSGQSLSTIRRWCDKGLLHFVRINGHRLIEVQSLSDLLEAGDAPPRAPRQSSSRARAIGRAARAQMGKEGW